LLDLADFLMHH